MRQRADNYIISRFSYLRKIPVNSSLKTEADRENLIDWRRVLDGWRSLSRAGKLPKSSQKTKTKQVIYLLIMSDFYTDYSRLPPSSEDLSLYKKKQDLKRLLSNRSDGSNNEDELFNEMVLADPVISKRGRGNRLTRNNDMRNSSGIRFIGIMGTNFPARLHDFLTLSTIEQDDELLVQGAEEYHDEHNHDTTKTSPPSNSPRIGTSNSSEQHQKHTASDHDDHRSNNFGDDAASCASISRVISWLPHGRAWVIHDKDEFIKVSRSHFHFTKYESFIRQVNAWGFKRVTRGKDVNSYYHEKFLRGMPHLVQSIKRNKAAASPSKQQSYYTPVESGSVVEGVALSLRRDPDFYALNESKPLLNYYDDPYHHDHGDKSTTHQEGSSSPSSSLVVSSSSLELVATKKTADDVNPHPRHTLCHPGAPAFLMKKKTSSSHEQFLKISNNGHDEDNHKKKKLKARTETIPPLSSFGRSEDNRERCFSFNLATDQNNTGIVGTRRRKFDVLLDDPTKQRTPPRRTSKRAKMFDCYSQMTGTTRALITPSPKSQAYFSFSFNREKEDDSTGQVKKDPGLSDGSSNLLNEVARIFEKNDEISCFAEDAAGSFTAQEEKFFDSLCLQIEKDDEDDDDEQVLIKFLENLFDEEETKQVELASSNDDV